MITIRYVANHAGFSPGDERTLLNHDRAEELIKRGVAQRVRESTGTGAGEITPTPPVTEAIRAFRESVGAGPRPSDLPAVPAVAAPDGRKNAPARKG